ncbi:hypothetical protein GCM10008090_27430 [Arenicella chitinivorans]|uniref:Aminoglycoside N(6')-acetyltransferase type 1 n=1 Tax=Arenicella chitinivorans TaxID=1329800 RepID=A0A918RYL5_9GAMM|nr:aminoglycoside 6'-N-acetyltransferase [Arenicella chitinivorans]GHA16146.1 hypothetical protein GCM10008090_27430 [Arenicella chitinivorans]
MALKIRPITPSDRLVWSAMRTELWPDAADAHRVEIDQFFAGESIDISAVLVADIDAQMAGFIELNLRSFAEGSRNSPVPYIEAWFVASEFRAQGVGRQLMASAEHWALENGYSEIASDTDLENRRSIAMHAHLGFRETERVVCFLKTLK